MKLRKLKHKNFKLYFEKFKIFGEYHFDCFITNNPLTLWSSYHVEDDLTVYEKPYNIPLTWKDLKRNLRRNNASKI